ncbi:Protein roadkill [Araneus ventricosus]|uniref:Protein roadkill n=1 Tax=Araneus ventricosus TaxID=182803 RepID=A0A4Y2CMN1_ARAVE|nr:Protein roadkill [Araneus ventricosus]
MLSKFSSEKGECTVIWKVENFSFCLEKTSKDICGVKFISEMIDYTNWILCLLKDSEAGENVVCLLKRKSGGPETVTIAFKVIALSPDGNDLLLTDVPTHTFEKDGYYTSDNLQETSGSLTNLLWKGTLILKCYLKKVVREERVSKTCFLRSRIEAETKDFLWTLKKYDLEAKCGNISIALNSMHGIKALKVELLCKLTEKFLIIRIYSEDYLSKSTYVRCKISLLDSKGNTLASAEDGHIFEKNSRSDIWRFPDFITRQMLTDFVFHLSFKLTISSKSDGKISEQNFYKFPLYQELDSVASEVSLNSDLLRLYSERKFCDVTLKAGDKEFGAHKNILSIRSPVFDSMFQNDMLEINTGVVNIPDVDAEILNMMLEYIYSDKFEDLRMENAMKLYQAADKYQILSLKDKCSSLLKSTLTTSNVFCVLAFADDHHDGKLHTAVKDFICIFGYELLDSDMWRNFMAERVSLAAEIMHQVTMNFLKSL